MTAYMTFFMKFFFVSWAINIRHFRHIHVRINIQWTIDDDGAQWSGCRQMHTNANTSTYRHLEYHIIAVNQSNNNNTNIPDEI